MANNTSMRQLSIGMISNRFHPIIGGTEQQALMIASALKERGYQLSIITRRISRNLAPYEELHAMPIYRLNPAGYGRLSNYLSAISFFFYILRHGRNFDLLHSHNVEHITLAAILATRLLHKPIICKVPSVGDITRGVAENYKLPWYVKVARRILNIPRWRPILLRWSHAIIAPSSGIRQEVVESGLASKCVEIPNAVDTGKFHPVNKSEQRKIQEELGLSQHSPIAIFVGRLVHRKGVDLLVRAWPDVLNEFPDAALLIIGSGEFQADSIEAELRDYVQKDQLSHSIIFTGNVRNVDQFLQASDLFVFPSSGEGLPNALLEAMATGIPISASRVKGVTDLIQHDRNGLLFPNNPNQISASILRIFRDEPMARQLGIEARSDVERIYSMTAILPKYTELYKRLLAQQNLSSG